MAPISIRWTIFPLVGPTRVNCQCSLCFLAFINRFRWVVYEIASGGCLVKSRLIELKILNIDVCNRVELLLRWTAVLAPFGDVAAQMSLILTKPCQCHSSLRLVSTEQGCCTLTILNDISEEFLVLLVYHW